ncbi:hypothetical protein BV394_09830 [Brevirhabdus pacifica]|uniref:Uncharacterized protein n=1 Tax=Brevirhabdus pacifica TaxID=1267768 RepID=A0A1U7DJB6_9RHOB|nr:hypothetical protein [Brevirhabdus pacifica]APX89979.1 hypothetical protein BV394_09830 [Brevirhabdus pacifica]OWU75419.1 hypothetical protein ATO5_12565 [Loktanella sp. 22II-4b]PJJ82784.1 hypothetical protein CLV77_2559 [Brevirhabdus pacifica]
MRRTHSTPVDLIRTGFQLQQLAIEAQLVIAWRLMGMAGMIPAAAGENQRMLSEKPEAFAEAAFAAGSALMRGRRADQVLAVWIRPLRKRTGANARRLTRGG